MGLMDGPLEIGPAHGPLGLTGLAGLLRSLGMIERASTPLSICLSDPQGQGEAVAQEGAQNSVKKGVPFRTHRSRVSVHASHESHEALTLHSPVAHPRSLSLTLLARCECLKRGMV